MSYSNLHNCEACYNEVEMYPHFCKVSLNLIKRVLVNF